MKAGFPRREWDASRSPFRQSRSGVRAAPCWLRCRFRTSRETMITGLAAFSGGSVGSLTYQISPRDGIRFMTSPRGETGLRQNRPKRDPRRSPQRLENRSSGTEAEMRSSSFCLLLLPNDLFQHRRHGPASSFLTQGLQAHHCLRARMSCFPWLRCSFFGIGDPPTEPITTPFLGMSNSMNTGVSAGSPSASWPVLLPR